MVSALCAAISEQRAKGQVFNIAGDPTWNTTGGAYVQDYFDLLGVPIEEARFMESPGWCDWYDTRASQDILQYQNTTYQAYLDQIRSQIEEMMGG